MTAQHTFGLDQEVKNALDAAVTAAGGVDSATKVTVKADLAAIRTSVIAALAAVDTLATAVNTAMAKINASTVIGLATNYAASNATNNAATSSPAALTTV